MSRLENLINDLESHIPDFEKSNATVSNSTIGWQIDHSLLVINGIIDELKNSNPDNYKWRFNKTRLLVQLINTIPRGRAKSPKVVTPIAVAGIQDLKKQLEFTKENITFLNTLPAKSYFTHPFFGDLKLKTAIWFLKLHTKHHLKINQDIMK